MLGPQHPFSESLHAEKYRNPGESFRDAMNRVAQATSDDDSHYHEFRDVLLKMRFMPGGRVQAAMGSARTVTPYNCFVSGTIDDTFVDGPGSIMARATDAAATMRLGGGIGYDFSTLRPRGATIHKLQSNSSGPISFMHIYDAVCKCVASSGHRRGAQMGVLRVDHPDVEEFIHAKQNADALTGFNISIAVTDEFMACVEQGLPFRLRFQGKTHKQIDARALWEAIMRSTWDWGEPGVLFIDRINAMNNLWYRETIAATNPCGEQPLPPHGACLLGSFNLTQYVGSGSFDFEQFAHDIPLVVRAMDNVIDRAVYPLFAQEQEAKSKRRMGLGVTGVANALESLGHEYGSRAYLEMQARILETLTRTAYIASIQLATEKGQFTALDRDMHVQGKFLQQDFMHDIPEMIARHGIRNSHLTSIAPTGTISLAADNISSGIEPVFAYQMDRTYIGPDGPETVELVDYGADRLGVRGKLAADVTAAEHLAVLTGAQRYMDSAVSKTVNVSGDMPWDDFKSLYQNAWAGGAKGCTTFNADGKRIAMLVAKEETVEACRVDEAGRRECE